MDAKKKKSAKKRQKKIAKKMKLVSSSKELSHVSFMDIPRELQIYIFSFCTQKELCNTVAPVCQEWWKLSKDPSLWTHLNIFARRTDNSKNLALLVKWGSSMLKELYIDTYWNCPVEDFAVASNACPNLRYLYLGKCNLLDSRILTLFVQNCPLLEELDLNECNKLDKTAVLAIVRLKHLRVLNLRGCRFVDNDCIKLISEKCTCLEDLNILWVAISNEAVVNLAENLNSTLLRLQLDGRLTDSAFSRISLCTTLQDLSIESGHQLTDETLEHLKLLTSLLSLTLHYSSMTTAAINNFFANPSTAGLVKLKLYYIGIDDEGVYNITQNCRLLEKLGLAMCCDITEVGLEHIVKHCENLYSLELSGQHELTGLCLNSVPDKLSRLEYLNLNTDEPTPVNEPVVSGIEQSLLIDLAKRAPYLKIIDMDGHMVLEDEYRGLRSKRSYVKKCRFEKKGDR